MVIVIKMLMNLNKNVQKKILLELFNNFVYLLPIKYIQNITKFVIIDLKDMMAMII